jgi:ATP-binding cassette subfamily B protein
VKSADQILVLQDGRILERGKHGELLRKDGIYRQIYDLELRDQEEALHPAQPEPAQVTATAAGS